MAFSLHSDLRYVDFTFCILSYKNPQPLETVCGWRAKDMADPRHWTEYFSRQEVDELDAAMRKARAKSRDLLDISREDFPLPTLSARLRRINLELLNGRGFVLLRGLPRKDYSNEEMSCLFWGIGMHLGKPWPQNKYGHLLGDVTDQGKSIDDPTARGNELGAIRLDYHSDASDLVGLLCLNQAVSGGRSMIANAVAIHNEMVRLRPDLVAELYKPQPFDFRGEQPRGAMAWYPMPVSPNGASAYFVRFIQPYILEAQRHSGAPKVTEAAKEGLAFIEALAEGGRFSVIMDFEPG